MNDCYSLKLGASGLRQSPDENSFMGGLPKLPPNEKIPRCQLCQSEESFFFQVAFPSRSVWEDLTLAVFACTACADENRLIPEMLQGPLLAAIIPDGFLEQYQTNFRFLIFDTAAARTHQNYNERITYRPIRLERMDHRDSNEHKVGGNPNWVLSDESPESYAEQSKMVFLLQLLSGLKFEIKANAPRQVELDLKGHPRPSAFTYYQLFSGNNVFLFGTENRAKPRVYAITQVN